MASRKEIVLYSCIVNGRDEPKPCLVDDGFQRVLFTDNLRLCAPSWEIRPLEWKCQDPVRTCRYHKHHPFDLFPYAKYAIWLDMTHWPYRSLKPLLTDSVLSVHRHNERSTIKAESKRCAELQLDDPVLLQTQAMYYFKEGFQDNYGLYSTSCLVMNNCPIYRQLSEIWWDEVCKWSKRDQVSLPYCLWRLGIVPDIIPGEDRNGKNDYFKFKSHYK